MAKICEYKIGLEVHMHLKTKEKLFCRCKIPRQNSPANIFICPICTGQPGAKPKLPNKTAIICLLKLALIFNSKIITNTNFQRKHYNWPDMPTGFQRTVSGGGVLGNAVGGEFENIKIREIHLEEDPAAWDPKTGKINYNRSGFPLVEIVTEPDFCDTEKLKNWLLELILLGKYLNCLNEEFGIKSDVNVSIKSCNFKRVEIKNVGSLSDIVNSAEFEIERQTKCFEDGKEVLQETRRFNEEKQITQFMRSKEDAKDYMFIPEVDLPCLEISQNLIDEIKKSLPETPNQKRKKYSIYNFDKETIEVLVSNLYLTEIFEFAIKKNLNPKEVGLFLRREILRVLNYHNESFEVLEKKYIKEEIISLIELLGLEKISYTTAQKVLEKLYEEKFIVKDYIEKNNLIQVEDLDLIKKIVRKALLESPKAVADFKSGNEKSLNFVVGIVMRETKGCAKPNIVQKILKEEIEKN